MKAIVPELQSYTAVCVVVERLCNKLTVHNISMNCIRKSRVWIVCVDEEEEEEMDVGVGIVKMSS